MALFVKLRPIESLIEKANNNYPGVFFNAENTPKWVDVNIVSLLGIPSIQLCILEEMNILSIDSFVGTDKLINKDRIIETLLISSIPDENYLIDGSEVIKDINK